MPGPVRQFVVSETFTVGLSDPLGFCSFGVDVLGAYVGGAVVCSSVGVWLGSNVSVTVVVSVKVCVIVAVLVGVWVGGGSAVAV